MATLPLFEQSAPTGAIHGQCSNHCSRTSEEPDAPRVDLKRALLYGFAWDLIGIFEPDGDQCASRSRHTTGRMDGRPRPRSNVWLDRQLHSWHWILFTTRAWTVGPSRASLLLSCLWTSGVAMRWFANIYGWHWRALLPVSAGFELIAVILFLYAASHHKLPASTQGNRAKASHGTLDGFRPDRDCGARVRCDLQFCRVRSIGYAGRPSVFSALARSEISRSAWLGICRSGSLGFFGAMAADLSCNLEAQCSLVSGSLMHGYSGRSLRRGRMAQARHDPLRL